jgi:hypothetical protein
VTAQKRHVLSLADKLLVVTVRSGREANRGVRGRHRGNVDDGKSKRHHHKFFISIVIRRGSASGRLRDRSLAAMRYELHSWQPKKRYLP